MTTNLLAFREAETEVDVVKLDKLAILMMPLYNVELIVQSILFTNIHRLWSLTPSTPLAR